jgi:hypothetical protein
MGTISIAISEFASEESRYARNGPDYSYGSYAQTPSRAPKYRYLLMASRRARKLDQRRTVECRF